MIEKSGAEYRVVSSPRKRAEMIHLFDELSDRDKQLKLWVRHEDRPISSGINEVFHFIFDDTDLGEDPQSEVGNILVSQDEVDAVRAVADALAMLLNKIGDVESEKFIADPDWPSVVDLAGLAVKIFFEKKGG